MQAKAPKEAGMRGAVAIIGGHRKRRSTRSLNRAGALQRGGVDQQEVVVIAGALRSEGVNSEVGMSRLGKPVTK